MNKGLQIQNQQKIGTTNKTRSFVGVELLRFILITTIVFQHCFLMPLAIGVPTFFLISGWFMVKQDKPRFKKMFVTTLVYTLFGFIIYGILYACGINACNPINAITDAQYLYDEKTSWWFLYIMLILTLLTPFLNMIVKKTGKWWSFGIIMALFFINMFAIEKYNTEYYTVSLLQVWYACIIYLVGAWFSLYCWDSLTKYKPWKLILFLTLVVAYFVLWGFEDYIIKFFNNINVSIFAFDARSRSSLNTIGIGIILISMFSWIKIEKDNLKWIGNIMAFMGKITLFIYLFHGIVYTLLHHFLPTWTIYQLGILTYFITVPVAMVIAPWIEKTINYFNNTNWLNKKASE